LVGRQVIPGPSLPLAVAATCPHWLPDARRSPAAGQLARPWGRRSRGGREERSPDSPRCAGSEGRLRSLGGCC